MDFMGMLKGIGSGFSTALQDPAMIDALTKLGAGDDMISQILGGIGKGAGAAAKGRLARRGPPKPKDMSGVPLAVPATGVPGGEGPMPGSAPPIEMPHPDTIGMSPPDMAGMGEEDDMFNPRKMLTGGFNRIY